MSDTNLIITIVAIISAVSALIIGIMKKIKKSDCFGVHLETRSDNSSPIEKKFSEDQILRLKNNVFKLFFYF